MKKYIIFFLLTFWATISFTQEIVHHYSPNHGLIENKGQWPEQVLFQTKFEGGKLWIEKHRMAFHFLDYEHHADGIKMQNIDDKKSMGYVLAMELVNPLTNTNVSTDKKSDHYFNFFIGNDKSKWVSQAFSYSEATAHTVYPGIDLKYITQKDRLKYEFIVEAHADPSVIQFEIKGAEKIQIQKDGSLRMKTPVGELIEQAPKVYQISNGKIITIPSKFVLKNNVLSYSLGNYNKNLVLVIDPELIFATYSGSVTDNFGMTATYDYNGNAYSGGIIFGNAYPTPDNNAYNTQSNFTGPSSAGYGITDVFISKFSEDGTRMLWTTFLGGGNNNNGTETVHSLIVNNSNELYLFGATSSTDFPTVNAYQSTHAGGTGNSNYFQNGVYFTNNGTDLFVAKLSENGHQLLGSTYFGGNANDGVNYKTSSGNYNTPTSYDSLTRNYGDQFRGEIMIDQNGDCIVASCTRSTNFPVKDATQSVLGGNQDGVVFRLSSDLSTLRWSTYVGGSNNDALYSVKVDSSYNIVVGGGTSSTNVPQVTNGLQNTYNGGKADGLIVKFSPNGQNILAATYLGTSNLDQVFFVEIDRNDKIFVLGQSEGGAFPVQNASFVNPNSGQFIAKLDENLSVIEHSTVFGNGNRNINISPSAFLVDICGNIYVSGWGGNILQSTPLQGMPISSDAFQATSPNGFDFYLMVLHRDFNQLLYGSYLGGNVAREHVDGGTSRFDKNGVVYQAACGGCPGVSDFPTTPNAYSNVNRSSNCNTLLFKFDFDLIPNAQFTADQTRGCSPFTVEFHNTSSDSDSYLWDFGNGVTSSTTFNPTITYTQAGQYEVWLYVTDSICLLTDSASVIVNVDSPFQLTTSADQLLCTPTEITLTAQTNSSGITYEWSTNPSFSPLLTADPTSGIYITTPSEPTTYYVRASNTACDKTDSIRIDFIGSSISLNGNINLCKNEVTNLSVLNANPLVQFNFTWHPFDSIYSGQSTSQVHLRPKVNQWIFVHAANNFGCEVWDSVFIKVSNLDPDSVYAFANPTTIYQGGNVELSAKPSGYTYNWLPNHSVNSPSNANTTAKVEETTTYTVTVTDDICTTSKQVLVKVYPFICGEPFVFIPNVFTPNNDGQNDKLFVYGDMVQQIEWRIFDRWGELVYETNSRGEGWDGTHKGKLLPPDVYDYYLKVNCDGGGTYIKKGNVTLMR